MVKWGEDKVKDDFWGMACITECIMVPLTGTHSTGKGLVPSCLSTSPFFTPVYLHILNTSVSFHYRTIRRQMQ